MDLFSIFIILIAGFGAGTVTGLVGASASTVVTPMMVTFLAYQPYVAISVSLITDVFASAVSAKTYYNHGNIDLKSGINLAVFAVLASVVGSYLAAGMDDSSLGGAMIFVVGGMGIKFIGEARAQKKEMLERQEKGISEEDAEKERVANIKETFFTKNKRFSSIFFGIIIGLICGIVGAGGGLMILMILTSVLGYELKTAVGTSVLIMTFTALAGGLSHFPHMDYIPVTEIAIASVGAIIGAAVAAKYANRVEKHLLSRTVGLTFLALGILMFIS